MMSDLDKSSVIAKGILHVVYALIITVMFFINNSKMEEKMIELEAEYLNIQQEITYMQNYLESSNADRMEIRDFLIGVIQRVDEVFYQHTPHFEIDGREFYCTPFYEEILTDGSDPAREAAVQPCKELEMKLNIENFEMIVPEGILPNRNQNK